tara:strand:- start:445 stop:744 length:300 start_codon:yes stop_codon:yes gene_type:complete
MLDNDYNIVIFLGIFIALIIAFIPNLIENLFYLLNLNIVRALFILYIAYLSRVNIDYSIIITLLFLIMLEISNRMLIENFEDDIEDEDEDEDEDSEDEE